MCDEHSSTTISFHAKNVKSFANILLILNHLAKLIPFMGNNLIIVNNFATRKAPYRNYHKYGI